MFTLYNVISLEASIAPIFAGVIPSLVRAFAAVVAPVPPLEIGTVGNLSEAKVPLLTSSAAWVWDVFAAPTSEAVSVILVPLFPFTVVGVPYGPVSPLPPFSPFGPVSPFGP